MKGIIIYKSKYGATKQYADWLSELLHLPTVESDNINTNNLQAYNFIVLGSSVYIGKLLIRQWLKENQEVLQNKKVFLFVVCGTPSDKKDKLDKIVRDNIPAEIKNRCEIFFLRGRIRRSALSWSDRFLLKIGALMAQNPNDKKNMSAEYDAVEKENLVPLLNAISIYSPGAENIRQTSRIL